MAHKLTAKQERFVQEYMIDLNATQAAIRAGYNPKTAKVIAYENLTKPYIAEAVQKAKQEIAERNKVDADYLVNSFKSIAERCQQAEPVMAKNAEGELVETGEYKFDSTGANRALENLGKHVGFFEKDNQQKMPKIRVNMQM